MCYTCGCGKPDDNMGHPREYHRTKTLMRGGEGRWRELHWKRAKKNALKLLKKVPGETKE